MTKKAYSKIMAGLQDALADARGERGRVTRVTTIVPIEPADVRRRLAMTQEQITEAFGIPAPTWRNWERHERELDSAGRLLLHMIAEHPKLVQKVAQRSFRQLDGQLAIKPRRGKKREARG